MKHIKIGQSVTVIVLEEWECERDRVFRLVEYIQKAW